MYSVCVRDHVMIAHSFSGDVFGPAQRLHGATYVVDAELGSQAVDADGIVADIGRVRHTLRALLAHLDYQNLDEMPEFHGRNTTTEFLAQTVFERYRDAVLDGRLGGDAADALESMTVTLRESPTGWASYSGALREAVPAENDSAPASI